MPPTTEPRDLFFDAASGEDITVVMVRDGNHVRPATDIELALLGKLDAARAEVLEGLAERVRGLTEPVYDGNHWTKESEHGWDTAMVAVLALLPDEETTP